MAFVPGSTRRIPVALPAAEVILTIPRPISRGGSGMDAARFRADAGATTTSIACTTASGLVYSDFEAAAFTTNDRFLGLKLTVNGETTFITDYAGGATGTFTLFPALRAAPATASICLLESDIPLHLSYLMIFALTDEVRFNTQDVAGMITAGSYSAIPSGMSNLVVDRESGVAGFRIRVASGAVGATTIGLDIGVP